MIRGTHDSAAYTFTSWYFKVPVLSDLLRSQAQNQTLSIKQQLEAGYRLFDLRVRMYKDKFYLSHTFYCRPLEEELAVLEPYQTSIFLDVREDFVTGNLNLAQRRELRELINRVLPFAIVFSSKTNIFPMTYKEAVTDALDPEELLPSAKRLVKKITEPTYIAFAVRSTRRTAIKRLLAGTSLLDLASSARKYIPELERIIKTNKNILGYTIDGGE